MSELGDLKRMNDEFIKFIETHYPNDSVIGEEASIEGDIDSNKWVIGPIERCDREVNGFVVSNGPVHEQVLDATQHLG